MARVETERLDVGAVYDDHADFVWRSLHRLGVRTADAPDLLQEVFVVVHRRRADWDGGPVRPWLWGIAVGLARNYRRRAFRRLESLEQPPPQPGGHRPDDELTRHRQRARGERMLGSLDPEKRAVFVMFEVEGMSGRAIAEALGVALGTVHSRLHAARRELAAMLAAAEEHDR